MVLGRAGAEGALHMVQECMQAIQHCVQEALRYHAARQPEAPTGHLWGVGRRRGLRGLPRGALGGLYREGGLAALGAIAGGAVDLGTCARAWAAEGLDVSILWRNP